MRAPFRIYIAGAFESQGRLRRRRYEIEQLGHTVVSTWLDEEGSPNPSAADKLAYAKRDLAEVIRSEILIVDTEDTNVRGGREVEYGIAIAMGKPVYVVGPVRNVFHALADGIFETWEEFIIGL